jgi:signal peptidase I
MIKYIVAVLALFIIQVSTISLYHVNSGSMEDTLAVGDTMIVLNYWYGFKIPFSDFVIFPGHKPKNGDILLFRNPVNRAETMVKRCMAVGGQTIEIQAKEVLVGEVKVPLPPHGKHVDNEIFPRGTSERDFMKRITVPDSTIFVLGDNRDVSGDSRVYGPVPNKNLIGKAWIIAYSLNPGVSWKDIRHKIRKGRVFAPVR